MKINWLSSARPESSSALAHLEARMIQFYQSSESYYENINFTANAWGHDANYRKLVALLARSERLLEVGCGRANILCAYPELGSRYMGCDFSPALIASNRKSFPSAKFSVLQASNELPFADAAFDAVFSTFVLEHCVFPERFLRECARVTAPGGIVVVICPDFLGRSGIPSQRAGLSPGTGRQKIRHGRFWDALVTGFDRKIRIPLKAAACRREANAGRGFWINLAPTCFTDPFIADVDAVYLTYLPEIAAYLQSQQVEVFDSESDNKNQIFIAGRKHVRA